MNDTVFMTPVAEYFGVAIVERDGDVEKVFDGKKYTTDGFMYIAQRRNQENVIPVTKFESERDVKDFIEAITPEQRAEYVGFVEFYAMYLDRPMPAVARFRWDETKQGFVPQDTAVDGLQRVVNLKGVLE